MLLGMEKTHMFARQPAFVTIDDLTQLAGALHSGLSLLSTYRHPLGVRKGVSKMRNERESMTVKAQGRMYFLDIKQTKEGSLFLVITESRSRKEDGGRERSSILVFDDSAQSFAQAVSDMTAKLKK